VSELDQQTEALRKDSEGVEVKAGRHREAVLYRALHGDSARAAGQPADLGALREQARASFEAIGEMPVWRRSGFWTTSFQDVDLAALSTPSHAPGTPLPANVAETLPDRPDAAVRRHVCGASGTEARPA